MWLKIVLFVFSLFFVLGGGSAFAGEAGKAWAKRCANEAPASCEVFQSLVLKKNKMRLAEVAISFPDGMDKNAKMAVILPLGIVVAKGIAVQVDGEEALKIPVHSCTQNGCISRIDLPHSFIKSMRAGKFFHIVFLDSTQKKVKIDMTLKGFSEAVAKKR